MNKIYVWAKKPKNNPKRVRIPLSLDSLQSIVEGPIETITLSRDTVLICNEEGLLLGLPYNCNICGCDFVGTIIMAGIKGDEFTDAPVDDKQVLRMMYPALFED